MGNKKSKSKKPKQNKGKAAGKKGGQMEFGDVGSPTPARKPKKKRK